MPPLPSSPPSAVGPKFVKAEAVLAPMAKLADQSIVLHHPKTLTSMAVFCLFELPHGQPAGLPFFLVQAAAKIIAGNRDGAFVRNATNRLVAPAPQDVERTRVKVNDSTELLLAGNYFYFVGSSSNYSWDYNALKKFEQWVWPGTPEYWKFSAAREVPGMHDPDWRRLQGPVAAQYCKNADKRCLITGVPSPVESAHLLPDSELAWYRKNGLASSLGMSRALGGPSNLITLRADLNGAVFNHGDFVLVPLDGDAVCFFLCGDARHVIDLAHGRTVPLPTRVAEEATFMRFGYNILKGVEEHPETRSEKRTSQKCTTGSASAASEASSPQKRPRSEPRGEESADGGASAAGRGSAGGRGSSQSGSGRPGSRQSMVEDIGSDDSLGDDEAAASSDESLAGPSVDDEHDKVVKKVVEWLCPQSAQGLGASFKGGAHLSEGISLP
ncbi:hypothetical protein B0H16DRAFT_466087 [Mycena metata]|uniref:HNH nuclease domain-containing protein n=1 Tax=Mycena metata TaxID=1033252 RepID=A0AAD7P0K3_9AGAR|nr:hypothetical protein B0H16DRAFT_466087 [Mycena metata]